MSLTTRQSYCRNCNVTTLQSYCYTFSSADIAAVVNFHIGFFPYDAVMRLIDIIRIVTFYAVYRENGLFSVYNMFI